METALGEGSKSKRKSRRVVRTDDSISAAVPIVLREGTTPTPEPFSAAIPTPDCTVPGEGSSRLRSRRLGQTTEQSTEPSAAAFLVLGERSSRRRARRLVQIPEPVPMAESLPSARMNMPSKRVIQSAVDEYLRLAEESQEGLDNLEVLVCRRVTVEQWINLVYPGIRFRLSDNGDLFITKVLLCLHGVVQGYMIYMVGNWCTAAGAGYVVSHAARIMRDSGRGGREADCSVYRRITRERTCVYENVFIVEVEGTQRTITALDELVRNDYFLHSHELRVVIVLRFYNLMEPRSRLGAGHDKATDMHFAAAGVVWTRGEGGVICITDIVSFGNAPLSSSVESEISRFTALTVRRPAGADIHLIRETDLDNLETQDPLWTDSIRIPAETLNASIDLILDLWQLFLKALTGHHQELKQLSEPRSVRRGRN